MQNEIPLMPHPSGCRWDGNTRSSNRTSIGTTHSEIALLCFPIRLVTPVWFYHPPSAYLRHDRGSCGVDAPPSIHDGRKPSVPSRMQTHVYLWRVFHDPGCTHMIVLSITIAGTATPSYTDCDHATGPCPCVTEHSTRVGEITICLGSLSNQNRHPIRHAGVHQQSERNQTRTDGP